MYVTDNIVKLCLLCLFCDVQALYSIPEVSIVGGKAVSIEKVPYMARYGPKHLYDKFFCGASIVHERFLVTAASCALSFKPDVKCVVNVGSGKTDKKGEFYEVDSVHPHPKFNKSAADIYSAYTVEVSDYDIAVIKLSQKLKFGKTVQPIRMAEIGAKYKERDVFDLLGFGTPTSGSFESNYLLKIEENIFNHENCTKVWKNYTKKDLITDRHICAGGKRGTGACWFDWGGPLLKKDTLVGVHSFFGRPCAAGVVPDVFTSIAAVRTFIDEIINSKVIQKTVKDLDSREPFVSIV